MNLHINDKFSLQDLVTKGSAARRYVKPDVLISDPTGGLFSEGDIIDANAVFRLVKEMSQGTDSHSMMELIQQLQQEIEELKANPVGPKHIILTQ